MSGVFKRKMSAATFVRKSRLVIGLDLTADTNKLRGPAAEAEKDRLERKALWIISETAEHAAAFKFNRQLVLPLGVFDRVPTLIDAIHDEGLTAIMDCKINDIGVTNHWIAKYYYDAGFDAVIVNPLVGWEGGLDSVFKQARERGRGVITICYMSHPAAEAGYGLEITPDRKTSEPLYMKFARRARKWEADGVIVGATYPELVKDIHKVLGDEVPILSPGVGAQGGKAHDAIKAGASYVIVARSIVEADDPKAAAAAIALETR